MPSLVDYSDIDLNTVRAAIAETRGNITAIARIIGVTRGKMLGYLNTRPALLVEINEARRNEDVVTVFNPEPAAISEAITRFHGQVNKISAHFGINERELYRWLDAHEEFKTEIAQARTAFAESLPTRVLYKAPASFAPDPEQFARAISEHNGNLAAVALQFRVSRWQVYNYLDNNPLARLAMEDAEKTKLDMAEAALYSAVLRREPWAIRFFLSTVGRVRGYITRGETLNVNVNLQDLSIEQLERLAAGEHPSNVLTSITGRSHSQESGDYYGETDDLDADQGAGDSGA